MEQAEYGRKKVLRDSMRELQNQAEALMTRHYIGLSEDPNIPELTRKLSSKVSEQAVDFSNSFEEQRVNFGKSHGLGNDLRRLAHAGVCALVRNDTKAVEEFRTIIRGLWGLLAELELPGDLAWTFDSENGQEMVEFEIVISLYPILVADNELNEISTIPSDKDLNVRPQTWLAGLGDAVTELGKMHRLRMTKHGLSKTQRLAMRERYLKIANGIRSSLDKFETAYAMIINNSRRKFFSDTFRGLLGRIDNLIERETDKVTDMLDQMAEQP